MEHTLTWAWFIRENPRGESMTWHNKVVRLVLAVAVLGALALAMGANYLDISDFGFW
jgi:hypothetical protein